MPKASKVPTAEPPRQAKVRALRLGYELLDPPTAAHAIEEIAEAFEACNGMPTKAAEHLGVGYKQINRWSLEHPALEQRINAVRARFGWVGAPKEKKPAKRKAPPVKRGRKAG